jgi:hypothetical protein
MVTGRARSQYDRSAASRRAYPASIASITRAPKSLEYGLRFDCPRIESVATDSLMDKPLGIDSTRGCAVRSSTRMQELLPGCRLRSNVIESALIVHF